jgi:hypothetical protein
LIALLDLETDLPAGLLGRQQYRDRDIAVL